MGIGKDHPLLGKRFGGRGLQGFGDGLGRRHQFDSQVCTGVAYAHVVGHEDYDIGFVGLSACQARPERES